MVTAPLAQSKAVHMHSTGGLQDAATHHGLVMHGDTERRAAGETQDDSGSSWKEGNAVRALACSGGEGQRTSTCAGGPIAAVVANRRHL
jgi:hypothetical protein